MRRALVFLALAGLVASGCGSAGIWDHDMVDPADEVAALPMAGSSMVELAEFGMIGVRAGAIISMVFPQDDEEIEWESETFLIEGALQLSLPMSFGLDARVGFMTYKNDEGSDDLDLLPVSLMATYRFDLMPDALELYLGIGLAFLFADIEDAEEVDEVDDALGWKIALGMNYNIGDHFSLGADISYVRVGTDVDYETLDDEEIDLDNVAVGISLMGKF